MNEKIIKIKWWQKLLIMGILTFFILPCSVKYFQIPSNQVTIGEVILFLFYILFWIDEIVYLTKIYKLDISNLENNKRQEIDKRKADALASDMILCAADMVNGSISNLESSENEKILRRKLKYKHECIKSVVTCLMPLAKK